MYLNDWPVEIFKRIKYRYDNYLRFYWEFIPKLFLNFNKQSLFNNRGTRTQNLKNYLLLIYNHGTAVYAVSSVLTYRITITDQSNDCTLYNKFMLYLHIKKNFKKFVTLFYAFK